MDTLVSISHKQHHQYQLGKLFEKNYLYYERVTMIEGY